ncbi:MAG: alpha-glucan family phosphorylase [Gammaproteobacteria bacterium]|nr:MAG: alpha-glucan family phosphorylase [Gammaproteobacteria bacterium]
MPGTRFSVEIQPIIPERLKRLEELANDLYYSWERRVRRLFIRLDEAVWEESGHNPKVFLRRVSQEKLEQASRDVIFLEEYHRVLSAYDTYLREKPHTELEKYLDPKEDLVAYFSAEYGFHESVPIYAGGLGILTGDYCKAISDLSVPFVAVGLLYHEGYFTQRIDCEGNQIEEYPYTDSADLPVSPARDAQGNELRVYLDLPGRNVALRVWESKVGHIRLYLLDSELPENAESDRAITYQLYAGDKNMRIQQEMVLGIGGTRALHALGPKPTVWHANEGHAAFMIIERCREAVASGMDFDSALELVASNTVFTTHTPVPAGHDVFDYALMRTYFGDCMRRLNIPEERLFALGANPNTPGGFNMTSLAVRGSRFRNGVSRIHGRVASEMESYIWPQIPPEENPIGYVTNGVHAPTFIGRPWAHLFDMYVGDGWRNKLTDARFWQEFIDSIPDHPYNSVRMLLKGDLLMDVRRRLIRQLKRERCPEPIIRRIIQNLGPQSLNTLVIGFARRFATYKRATLLFHDLDRLERLVNDPERPVLFIFAGKAHPNDYPGKQMLKQVADISLRPEFVGKVLLVEDYNLALARRLAPGVDVWLNNPEYPKEACGTSGMKAAINGAINLSVLDGWWAEAYNGENGWAITPHPEMNPEARKEAESMELLDILEEQVIPLFYQSDAEGEKVAWTRKSKASMKSVMPMYNSRRMAADYIRTYYSEARKLYVSLSKDGAAGAKTLSQWKKKVIAAWPNLRMRLASTPPQAIKTGEPMPIEVAVLLNGLTPQDVALECLLGKEDEMGEFKPTSSFHLLPTGEMTPEGETLFKGDLCSPELCLPVHGLQHYKIRLYPFHPLLSHRFETGCMLWL